MCGQILSLLTSKLLLAPCVDAELVVYRQPAFATRTHKHRLMEVYQDGSSEEERTSVFIPMLEPEVLIEWTLSCLLL